VALIIWVESEYWIGKNAEGSDRGTAGDTIPELYGYVTKHTNLLTQITQYLGRALNMEPLQSRDATQYTSNFRP